MAATLRIETLPDPGNRYTLGELIGSGVCAKVYRATDTQAGNKSVAIKVQKFEGETKIAIQEEFRILRDHSKHANLLDFYGVYRKKCPAGESDEIWFVLEYCEYGPVIDVVRKLFVANRRANEVQLAYILREASKALVYLHENHIVHRDVRGSNILLTRDGEVKLADYGLARDTKTTLGKRGTCIGSPCWMAPEVVTSSKSDKDVYDNRTDVWALGITAIELGDGKAPFADMHATRAMFQIVRNPPPTLYRQSNWTQEYNDFIAECLEKNPDHRPFIMEIVEHPFLTQVPENDYHLSQELKMMADSVRHIQLTKKEEVSVMRGVLKTEDNRTEKMHVEDLAALEQLSEETILEELVQRYRNGNTYTFVGDVLVSLNPNESIPEYVRGFHSKYMFKSRSDNAPHVFAIADSAYQDMLHHEEPQHIILAGESYSGKTTNLKLLMKHLGVLGEGNPGVYERIVNGYKALCALTNAGTPINPNSTRSIMQVQMTFGPSGKLSGAIFWVYLLEKLRISSTNMNHSNFHIFYYFYDTMDAEERLKDFSLESGRSYRYLRISEAMSSDKLKYCRDDVQGNVRSFKEFEQQLLGLELSQNILDTIYRTLAAILILGEVRFKETEGMTELEDFEVIGKIASLLQVDEKKFQWALLNYCVIVRGSAERRRHTADEARDARDVLAATIYTRLVDWITNTVNQKLAFGRAIYGDKHSVTITDHFGFECFHRNHIDQLVVNSLNEQMQYLYNQRIFVFEMIEMEEEQVPMASLHYYDNKLAVDHILTKPKGVFSYIDDASRGRHGQNYIIDSIQSNKSPFIKRSSGHEFTVAHYTGRVTYDARDMADKNRDFIPPEMVETLRASEEPIIKIMFSNQLSRTGNLTMAAEEALGVPSDKPTKKKRWGAALVAEKNKAKKMNTLSKGMYSQVHKMRTIAGVFRATSLELIKTLSIGPNSGGTHFVRCIRSDLEYKPKGFATEMVRQQVRAMAVLDTARGRQKGFSHRIPFQEFLRRYQFLAFDFDENVEMTRDNCRLLLIRLKLEGWVIGKTKVFLKYYNVEYLQRLYETQVKKIIKIQSMMRAFLAKRSVATKLKQVHRESVRKREAAAGVEAKDEAALKIQSAYRGHLARKKYRPLINERTGNLDTDTANFLKPFVYRWRKKSMYQVLLHYRAARYQDLVNISQQVHIYNQRVVAGFATNSNCIMLEKIDPTQRNPAQLGPHKSAVWKLRFRFDDIPFFDTTYMCDPSSASYIYTGNDSDSEDWDAPLRRRKNLSSEITQSTQRGLRMGDEGHGEHSLANEPFHRDPSLPIKRLSPHGRVEPCVVNRVRSPVQSPIGMPSSVYSPVPYTRQTVDDIRNKFSATSFDDVGGGGLPIKTTVYKKRAAPRAPLPMESEPAEIQAKPVKKRPAPQPVHVGVRPITPTKIDPIREMELIGKKNTDENDNSDDEPPFNFQGMLRKTNYNRASMKRTSEGYSLTGTSIDFEDTNNNNNANNNSNSYYPAANSEFNRKQASPTNVVYQSNRASERPKSCQGTENGTSSRRGSSSPNARKLSLAQDSMMLNDQQPGPSRSRSTTPQDENRNFLGMTGIKGEEIVPGVIVEAEYVEEF
ncbi:neither inactivation nor afterpotential protein C [Anopheles darlingi]|uniref:neither inactivation nor afterpotential protein C n=1 Tax=Anopheles darlingi TaxID=43151 RepID=UPI002100232D|nr:neither inactivation nor afterpotential protein C [Anopheles darlingi]XP_049532766.1 neither inactivation nor afterpotential protein C [Anopheles darlingi]XP_049532767.1 neither inactivation nor afterpotential protein C [Anopheles darlingi]XP_049532768.1 neither inactivation nor afterpotential protein C [Anopheles darlingi]XP_049532769.1 neither inactivation nor afterpotential protein C [Anopheles darlingi]XP_049532770.1 neither inactivation nor afterpotential protein C [Anopheles darlingi]